MKEPTARRIAVPFEPAAEDFGEARGAATSVVSTPSARRGRRADRC